MARAIVRRPSSWTTDDRARPAWTATQSGWEVVTELWGSSVAWTYGTTASTLRAKPPEATSDASL
jgi:hypothetical protein